MQRLIADRFVFPGGLMLGQQDAREGPVLRVHTDYRGHRSRLFRHVVVTRNLGSDGYCQIGIDRNAQFPLIDEVSLAGWSAPRVQREMRLDIFASTGRGRAGRRSCSTCQWLSVPYTPTRQSKPILAVSPSPVDR